MPCALQQRMQVCQKSSGFCLCALFLPLLVLQGITELLRFMHTCIKSASTVSALELKWSWLQSTLLKLISLITSRITAPMIPATTRLLSLAPVYNLPAVPQDVVSKRTCLF
ncbi:hypothetical protein ILYODFUR_028615 [Ilyodon furcidens]|uniref:Uncharacterized protein n=1 Tax=Ilyodon furcidens TaxID=33524 RepID=A0ABV0U9B0_9TELE